jgi:hypothetical protein
MAHYKFKNNILELSQTKNENLIHTEWIRLAYVDLHMHELEKCICGHVLRKELYRYLNTKTKRMINVGSGCVKKLHLSECRDSTTMIKNFISGLRGEYMEIIDLIEYSDENWRSFLRELNSAMAGWTNGDALHHIYSILENLQGMQNKDLFHRVEKELTNIITDISKNIETKKRIAAEERAAKELAEKHEQEKRKREQEKIVAEERAARERAEKHAQNIREQERIAVEARAAREREQKEAIKIAQEHYLEQQRIIKQEECEKTKLFNTFIRSLETQQYIKEVMAKNKPFTTQKEEKLFQRLKEMHSKQLIPR